MALTAIVATLAAAAPVDLSTFVRLRLTGLGRYQSAPALFLAENRGGGSGLVLPVPVPFDSEMAIEQALSPRVPALLEVCLHAQAASKRDDGLFDNLPWKWNPSPQAKRDAFARFSGRGYPREGYPSPYHLMLDMMRRDACCDVSHVIIENTAVLGDGIVVGGALICERRLPQALNSGDKYAMGAGPAALPDSRWWVASKEGNGNFDNEKDDGIAELTSSMVSDGAHLCECTAEEALGLSIAVDGGTVYVERAVWEACALPPAYNTQRGKMRLEVMPKSDRLDLERAFKLEAADAERQKARPPAPLPWEITSADELINLDLTDKALSAMRAGMRLPRAREATDEKLTEMLQPFLDENVRRELMMRQALESGDLGAYQALESQTSKRGRLLKELRRAVEEEKYYKAAELSKELRVETNRRQDVTQDEGSYDRYLDQDVWYAQGAEGS